MIVLTVSFLKAKWLIWSPGRYFLSSFLSGWPIAAAATPLQPAKTDMDMTAPGRLVFGFYPRSTDFNQANLFLSYVVSDWNLSFRSVDWNQFRLESGV